MTRLNRPTALLLRRTVLTGAISALGLASAVTAQPADPALVNLQVINRETGQAATVWRHDGRLFVAGQPGARYSLRVSNNTPGRVLVVMSVDGINIITGETAGFGQEGYVFRPHQTYDVSGWRKSDAEVADFTFAPLPRSYAAQTGRPNDVGVIGLAAFTERAVPPPPPRQTYVPPIPQSQDGSARDDTVTEEVVVTGSRLRSAPAEAPSASAALAAQAPKPTDKLGTEHGAREWSTVTRVAFVRASPYPQQISRVEYDSTENLIAQGVIPGPRPAPPIPRAFPATPGDHHYVPDPPHRR